MELRQLLAISGVFLLLGAALWWLRSKGLARYGTRPSRARKRTLESVERLTLGPQHSVHLVRVAGRALLLGTSPAGCSVLESFEWAQVESTPTPEGR